VKIECRDLSFAYDEGRSSVPALTNVSFTLAEGGATALLGPSGSGKSTVLQLIRGLLTPAAGTVVLDGISPSDAEEYARRQRQVGLVFQMPEMQLFATSGGEDVAFGPRQLGWPADEVARAVSDAFELVGLPEQQFAARHPYSLSGGEQRRLAIAGVLAMRPRALLLDEPFVSLDPGSRRELAAVLDRLLGQGMTIVLATHDVDQAWSLCSERVVLAEGRVVDGGGWRIDAGGADALTSHRLRVPFLAELWLRLGRGGDGGALPRTPEQAARELLP
jgi:energy-coupling factor transporter ATP-binding protein EcfA2